MSFLASYAVICVLILSIYLFTTKHLTLNDFIDVFESVKNTFSSRLSISLNRDASKCLDLKSPLSNSDLILKKSLRHLEFISELESYLDHNKDCLLSIDFLQELEDSKLRAKISVLKSAVILNSDVNKKAA